MDADGIADAASSVVRHSTSALSFAADEFTKQVNVIGQIATSKDPLAWIAGDDGDEDAGFAADGSPPLIVPVPLSALQPWDTGGHLGGFHDYSDDYGYGGSSTSAGYGGAVSSTAAAASHIVDEDGVAPQQLPAGVREGPPWGVDAELNAKVFLWDGDLCALEVDAIVAPTAAGYSTGASTVLERILRCGGRDLRADLRCLEQCRSGEARLCKAYGMPCRRLVLTVGPKYKEKYQVAAQNTLNNCYRESMQLLVEDELRSVAIPCTWYYKGYPPEEQAHVALRTIRRSLEKLRHVVDAVVFVASQPHEAELYDSLLPLYFPRTAWEVEAATRDLPDSCWNKWGEVTVEERRIRVSNLITNSCEDDDDDEDRCEPIFSAGDDRAFLEARDDADSAAVRRLQGTMREAEDNDAARHAFLRYLRRARELPEEPPDRRFIFRVDKSATPAQRRIVLLLGARLPSLGVQDQRTLALFVKELEQLQGERFILLYVNSGVEALDSSKLEVLQEMLTVISARYQNTIDMLLVLHPGMWFRAAFMVGRAVCDIAARAWHDTAYVESLADLACYDIIADRLDLPAYVRQWELG